MQALGFIETRGLLAAVEGADAMLKAAEVTLIEKTYVGGGLVSIAVSGDVGAVKAAVEAGAAAIQQLCDTLLVSQHVIPRPHEEVNSLILPLNPHKDIEEQQEEILNSVADVVLTDERTTVEETKLVEEVKTIEETITNEVTLTDQIEIREPSLADMDFDKMNKQDFDNIVKEYGIGKALEILNRLKVTKLRNLAREFKNLRIAGRVISKADKKLLIAEFKEYYKKN